MASPGIKATAPGILTKKREEKHVKKTWLIILLSVAGGMALLGGLGVAVWNSKQMRMARAVKRTGKILYQAGTALRSVSGVMAE